LVYGESETHSGFLMTSEEALLWNLRYQDDQTILYEMERPLLRDHLEYIPPNGLALDIAMGVGGNANYLIQHGLRVIGVDISYVALCRAKRNIPELMAVVADLEHFQIPQNTFDIIINFLYLQRSLWLPIIQGLKIGGMMFIECLTIDMLMIHPEINPTFLLLPGELRSAFFNTEISKHVELLYYFEGWQSTEALHPRAIASLIARRVGS
jgi:tellurite methyltransferase